MGDQSDEFIHFLGPGESVVDVVKNLDGFFLKVLEDAFGGHIHESIAKAKGSQTIILLGKSDCLCTGQDGRYIGWSPTVINNFIKIQFSSSCLK
jgi:hypothetical protein